MAKEILEELLDELRQLKQDELEKVSKALEEKKLPPLPMKPHTVLKKINEVVRNHQLTPEEYAYLLETQQVPNRKELVESYAASMKQA